MRPSHHLLILLINCVWGINVIPVKLSLDEIPPITAAFLRLAMVFLICLPAMRIVPGSMGRIVVVALLLGALHFGLTNAAFAVATNVGALSVAGQLGVPFSLILAIIFLRERIRWKRVLGILLAVAGVGILSFDPKIADERMALALITGATLCYSISTILIRGLAGINVLNLQAWIAGISILPLLGLSLVMEPGAVHALKTESWQPFAYILFSAAMASVVGHAGLAWLLQRYPVTVISPLTLPAPVLSVIAAVLILGNALTVQMIIGGIVTMIGVAIITWRSAKAVEGDI